MTQMRTPRLRDTRTWKSRRVTCGCPLVFTFPGSLGGLCGCLGMSGRWGGCPWHLCLIPQLSLECAQDVIQLLVHLHDLLGNQRAEELSDGCKCCWWEAFRGQKQGKSLAGSMGIWEPPTPWVLSSLLLWSRWHCKVTGTMAGEEQDIAGPRTQFKHFVSQPFPRADDDASCKYLPWNSPSLFGLLWMFFSQYLSQPSPPLLVGHHAFHYCPGKWNSLPSLHTVNRCLSDTCCSQRSYQIWCLFPCTFRRIAY